MILTKFTTITGHKFYPQSSYVSVSPESQENAQAALKRHLDLTRSMEVAPPEVSLPFSLSLSKINQEAHDNHYNLLYMFDENYQSADSRLILAQFE